MDIGKAKATRGHKKKSQPTSDNARVEKDEKMRRNYAT